MTTSQYIGGRATAERTYVGEGPAPDTVGSASTMAFSNVSFGAAEQGRVVAMVVSWVSTGSDQAMTSATIAGVIASIEVQRSAAIVGGFLRAAIISAEVSAGTSGSTSLTFAGSVDNPVELQVYNIVGLISPTALDTDSFQNNTTSTTASAFVDVQAGGVALFGVIARNSGNPFTLTGVTEDFDDLFAASSLIRRAGGSLNVTADETAREIAASTTGNFTGPGVAASYR